MTNYIDAKHLSNNAMINGNEKKYSIIVDNRIVKQWVGFCWIELREATAADENAYPTIKRK